MINKESIISLFNDKPTLLEWLKKVEAALKNASASSFKVNKKGNATLTFSIVFNDGSEIESDAITLQQGESVQSAAIVNGHLILTLTNGDELDAGAIFSGDVNIGGHLIADSIESLQGCRVHADLAVDGTSILTGGVSTGGTITAASGTFPIINGESNPSVKPVYCHPIYLYIRDNTDAYNLFLGCMLILDNTSAAYNETALKAKLKALLDVGAYIDFNGVARGSDSEQFGPSILMLKDGALYKMMYSKASDGAIVAEDIDLEGNTLVWHVFDGVNKIN